MPKKSQAIKITDIDAPWNRNKEPRTYSERIYIKKTLLIVCEGQTEARYFKSFPVTTNYKVITLDTEGQSKLKLIDTASKHLRISNDEFDEVWCVFDMDKKEGKKEFADFDNAIKKAQEIGYKVAYSNDVFELWFYLHYQLTEQANLRKFYYDELTKFFGLNYLKECKKLEFCKQIYEKLNADPRASQTDAIKRANSLFKSKEDLKYSKQNPVTKVYELVVELNKNLRQ